ncbi:hypothetical protein EVAR_62064_1 [Eumeta japonica]|uniref:Uncharacterized protein n=1 Tax=Eumeta variegata TaxID=151549 RepID=A0A4C1YW12_EUMVA|nr:hypothetical protein EVAR_62064_1 [Eumeta japonica]
MSTNIVEQENTGDSSLRTAALCVPERSLKEEFKVRREHYIRAFHNSTETLKTCRASGAAPRSFVRRGRGERKSRRHKEGSRGASRLNVRAGIVRRRPGDGGAPAGRPRPSAAPRVNKRALPRHALPRDAHYGMWAARLLYVSYENAE